MPNTNDFGTPEAHRRFSSSLVIIISVCLDSQPTLSFVSSFKRIVELLVGGGWSCQGSWGRWGLFHACAEVAHTVAGSLEDTVFSVVSRTTNGPIVQQCQMLGALQVYTEKLKRKLRCFTHAVEKVANSPCSRVICVLVFLCIAVRSCSVHAVLNRVSSFCFLVKGPSSSENYAPFRSNIKFRVS